ncbi:MAG: O-antigen ligase family protein [Chloroflexi bacterium]|nr:O-antigen ligase family protein [Chloroflexota bacterium]
MSSELLRVPQPHGVAIWRVTLPAFFLLALAWLLATLPLPLIGLLLGAGGGGLLLLRHPWLVWPGIALVLPFTSGLKSGALSLTDLLLAAAIALWFADGARRKSVRLTPHALPGWIAPYLAALLLSTYRAVDLTEAASEVIKWTELLLVVWLVGQTLTPVQSRWLVLTLLAGGAAQGLLGVYQFLFHIGPDAFVLLGRFMRAAGSFHQPNPYAGYLGLTLPVAVSLALWAWQRVAAYGGLPVRRTEALVWALLYSGLAGAMGAGLLASGSRGGWLGAAAGVGLVVLARSRRMLMAGLVGLLALLLWGAMGGLSPAAIPAPIAERLADVPAYFGVGISQIVTQPVTDENFSVIERLAHWLAAARMWETAPWLGVGAGNYAAVYPQVRLPLWEDALGHAHNIYLNVLAESGLIGLAAYLLMWGGIVVWLWKATRRNRSGSWEQALLVGVLGVAAHLTVHHLFDNLYVQGIHLHIGLWLGAAAAQSHGKSPAEAQRRREKRKDLRI